MSGVSVLYVDEGEISSSFTTLLNRKFEKVLICDDMLLAESAIDTMQPQVIIIEIGTNEIYAYDLITKIRNKNKFTNIIVYTKINDAKTILRYIPLNLQDYLIRTDPMFQIEKSLTHVIKKCYRGLNKEDGIRLKNKLTWYPKSKKLIKSKRGKEVELKLTPIQRKIFFIIGGNKNGFTSSEALMLQIYDTENANEKETSRLRTAFHRLNEKFYNENFFESKYNSGYRLRYA